MSVVNSLYDPLGLAAPVAVKGKLLLRAMIAKPEPENWDEPLPEEQRPAWEAWCQALQALTLLRVPRCYTTTSLKAVSRRELHTFCDASKEAIGAVSYLRTIQCDGNMQVSFVLGKAKLAPSYATNVPHLELCAAVLGIETTELIIEELDLDLQAVAFYSDSRVVLGYISNESRRFYVYVSNRVERIRKSSSPEQWFYVPTQKNPADLATRSVQAQNLKDSIWHSGPQFLYHHGSSVNETISSDASLPTEDDPEVRPLVKSLATRVLQNKSLGTSRFSRFSRWEALMNALARLISLVQLHQQKTSEEPGAHKSQKTALVHNLSKAKSLIIQNVQYEAFKEEIHCLRSSERLPKSSPLLKLSPVIDKEGFVRVGGRLEQAGLSYEERHPLILPSSHHVTTLLVTYYHGRVQHQGRHFTLGLIRSSGFWIIGGKRIVNSVINSCIKCKKLRGRQQIQKMADLPVERLTPAPPFSYVGLNVFGPWTVSARRTRGGVANSKRWAVLFTCLTIRAIHIELLESMDTSSFINALRRFLALRGPVVQLRSDCGTNFVGAHNELQSCLKEMDEGAIQSYLAAEGCDWIFNPPHASHAGGVWERMIGVTRRILDSIFADLGPRHLTHEVLSTLMAEVTAIVNARPLIPVPSDPDMPEILTPATLLTQKSESLKAMPGNFTQQELYSKQWRQVQHLANVFWARWRREFLPTLQPRRKWQQEVKNLQEGDLVLLCSKDLPRNCWPLARITRAHVSADGKVRKVELVTAKDGPARTYTRPVNEVILLRSERDFKKMETSVG